MRTINRKVLLYGFLYILTFGIILSVFIFTPEDHNQYPIVRLFIITFASVLLTKYFIYMFASPWYEVIMTYKRRKWEKENILYNPRVSVIIPAWNEEVGLLSTVKTVLKSTYKNTEVIVVNDGSTDNSDKMMREFTAMYEKMTEGLEHKIDLKYHYKENGGKGRALNYGIGISTGEIIMSIDADCIVAPETVANFVKQFRDPTVMAAVGNVKIGNMGTIIGTLQYLEFLFSFYFKKADSVFNTIYIIGGAAGAFRKEVFDKIGLYNHTNITEDIELSVRIQDAGMKIVYASDAIVYTEGANNLSGLMKQRLRWKRGRFQTFADHKHLFFSSKPRHNKALTWVVLPLAIFGDTQLFFEVLFLGFLYVYSFLSNDYSSFISGILVVSSMFVVQMIDDKSTRRASLFVLAPIGWMLFYITTFVEYYALVKSLWLTASGQEVRWQKWQRKGCLADAH